MAGSKKLMRVFISSIISGMEEFRDAAVRGARCLAHETIRAENFGAQADSPRNSCLAGVREADAVILLVGERYGTRQPSGLSATHEEYREAKERCPILVMVQDGVEREVSQTNFLNEVRDWTAGLYTASFTNADQLLDAVVRALHELEMAQNAGAVDPDQMLQRAHALLPSRRSDYSSATPGLAMALVGGPQQEVLRPAQLDDTAFQNCLQQMALFGDGPILDSREGTEVSVEGNMLVFSQQPCSFSVREDGSILFITRIRFTDQGLPTIIQEDVHDCIERFLNFSCAVLTSIDPTNRLSHCVPSVLITEAGFLEWRTRAEHEANPNSVAINIHNNSESLSSVSLLPPHRTRSALRLNSGDLAEDLTVKLRRTLLNPRREPW